VGGGGGGNFTGPRDAQKRLRLEDFTSEARGFFTGELDIPSERAARRPTAAENLAIEQRDTLSAAYAKYREAKLAGEEEDGAQPFSVKDWWVNCSSDVYTEHGWSVPKAVRD